LMQTVAIEVLMAAECTIWYKRGPLV
ncbi:MAG: hypothetical protein K0R81_2828, partial [Microbacterium sp.]|nr:hypothetical protein [Microbacterium sp.]